LIKPCMALLIILDTGCVARCLLHRFLTRGCCIGSLALFVAFEDL
jgi:hypothetical protein